MVSDSFSAPYGTTPAGWTNLINYAGNSAAVGIFYKIASGSEGDVTVTVVHADHIAWYLRVSGVNTTTPFNVTASPATGIGSSRAIPEVTTTVDSCLAFYLLSFDGGDGYPFSVSGTGWTESDDHQSSTGGSVSSGCWGTKEQATAGLTGDATVSCSASDGQAYLQFAVAPA